MCKFEYTHTVAAAKKQKYISFHFFSYKQIFSEVKNIIPLSKFLFLLCFFWATFEFLTLQIKIQSITLTNFYLQTKLLYVTIYLRPKLQCVNNYLLMKLIYVTLYLQTKLRYI